MYVLSLFEHSLKLELALAELEEHHISKDSILATTIKNPLVEKKYLDPYNADGLNLFIVSLLGMVFMLLGTIYGFVIIGGPVLWGLIGLIIGSLIGFCLDFYYKKKNQKHTLKKNNIDVIVVVECDEGTVELVESILTNHHSLGLARIL